MSLKFVCEGCGAKLAIKDGAEGRRIKCPKCGAMIGVPVERVVLPIVVDPDKDFLKGAIRPGWWYWLAGLLVGLVVCVTVVVYQTTREPTPGVAESETAADDHSYDPNHPDYGFFIKMAVFDNAVKKRVSTDSNWHHDWYRSLTPNEQKAWILLTLEHNVGILMRNGFDAELPDVIRLLREDLNTPASRAIAEQLDLLLPLVGKMAEPDPDNEAAYNAYIERGKTISKVDDAVRPWRESLSKDTDRFFYYRWRQQGKNMFR
jgi:DNA-directed RNA polymerase subunit RPC12/RpoP